jgi:hypothetical protein
MMTEVNRLRKPGEASGGAVVEEVFCLQQKVFGFLARCPIATTFLERSAV